MALAAGEVWTADSVGPRRAARGIVGAPPAPVASVRGLNALTVDLEDWYHVCGAGSAEDLSQWNAYESRVVRSTDRLLSLLRSHGVRATFFVLGYVAEREPALIRAIAREGHEVGLHGHLHRRIFEMSPAEFEEDLVRAQAAVSAAAGTDVIGYRAPEWSMRPHTLWALPVLRKRGILYDSSMVPLTRMGDRSFPRVPCRFDTPSGEIVEFPLTTVRCFGESIPFSGGLPLRLTPYFYIVSQIRRLNEAGKPALVYVHPWEFDLEQPRIGLPWSRRFMHYFNLPATPRKLTGLLTHLRFAPIREVLVA
jgi:polysaccharide deacetylase family protein (PEP-CTERM system associated)